MNYIEEKRAVEQVVEAVPWKYAWKGGLPFSKNLLYDSLVDGAA
jgi:hypothetical protein